MHNVATQGVFGDGSGNPGKSSLFFLTLSPFCPGIDLVSDRENKQARAAPLWFRPVRFRRPLKIQMRTSINTPRRTHNRNRSPR